MSEIKSGDFVKIVESKGRFREVHYGVCEQVDELSITATVCDDKDKDSIFIGTFDLKEYTPFKVDPALVRKVFSMARLYRERKLDGAEFDLDIEKSKMEQVQKLYDEYFK